MGIRTPTLLLSLALCGLGTNVTADSPEPDAHVHDFHFLMPKGWAENADGNSVAPRNLRPGEVAIVVFSSSFQYSGNLPELIRAELAKLREKGYRLDIGQPSVGHHANGFDVAGLKAKFTRLDNTGAASEGTVELLAVSAKGRAATSTAVCTPAACKQYSDDLASVGSSLHFGDTGRQMHEPLSEADAPQQGVLGVRVVTLKPEYAAQHGLNGVSGTLVTQVSPGSAADRADLQAGDVITSLNGQSVATGPDLSKATAHLVVGESIDVGFLRDGKARHAVAAAQARAIMAEAGTPPTASPAKHTRPERAGDRFDGLYLGMSNRRVEVGVGVEQRYAFYRFYSNGAFVFFHPGYSNIPDPNPSLSPADPAFSGTYTVTAADTISLSADRRTDEFIVRSDKLTILPSTANPDFGKVIEMCTCEAVRLNGRFRNRDTNQVVLFSSDGSFQVAGGLLAFSGPSASKPLPSDGRGTYATGRESMSLTFSNGQRAAVFLSAPAGFGNAPPWIIIGYNKVDRF